MLDGKGASYRVVELDVVDDGKALRAEMAGIINRTSVPAIWIEGVYVGGCNDGGLGGIMKIDETGQLDQLLASAGAI